MIKWIKQIINSLKNIETNNTENYNTEEIKAHIQHNINKESWE